MALPTSQQQRAIEATGDVLVVAGAGAGKTSTLVRRILSRVLSDQNPVSLERFLVVTFTDAAAAEMRHRLRLGLESHLVASPSDTRAVEQLAIMELAQVSTLHSLCLRLVREHFHVLGLDPQFAIQDAMQNQILGREVMQEVLGRYFAQASAAESGMVRRFLSRFAADQENAVRDLILRIHDFARTLPDPARWLAWQKAAYSEASPTCWETWMAGGLGQWAAGWLDHVEAVTRRDPENVVAGRLDAPLRRIMALGSAAGRGSRVEAFEALSDLVRTGAKANFPKGTLTKWRGPIEDLLDEAAEAAGYLGDSAADGSDPLVEDWTACRQDALALLLLVEEFMSAFSEARRAGAVVDFADLEQDAIRLLWDAAAGAPTALAERLRAQFEYVFVDEYQDINGAQDRILSCLSRDGAAANRFYVGDVKQSIYRFRRADPRIFQAYAREWRGGEHRGVVSLAENFRSHERILGFVNQLFSTLMRDSVGGVAYDNEARLVFGAPDLRAAMRERPEGRVELLLHVSGDDSGDSAAGEAGESADEAEDLDTEEAQAAMVAVRLREMRDGGVQVLDSERGEARSMEWRDIVVLHPAPRPVAERWARRFATAGVPLEARRGGFFEALEVSDLVNLIRLVDNPRQDFPLLAVLRSPLVGMSMEELAAVRLSGRGMDLWDALHRLAESGADKASSFLRSFERWRRLATERSLARCLETLLGESNYEAWLRSQPRADARLANVRKLLSMARDFDQFQRHGVFRFLRHLEAQATAGQEVESASSAGATGVRLMSIHQSKGLEFPVVVVAGLGRTFNRADLQGEWVVEGHYGVCPPVVVSVDRRYPSFPRWLAGDRLRREFAGEQIRLLYVACTRASEWLLLAGTTKASAMQRWTESSGGESAHEITKASRPLAWLGPRIAELTGNGDWSASPQGSGTWLNWRLVRGLPAVPASPLSDDAPAPSAPDAESVEELRRKLRWRYPYPSALQEPAKVAVTTLGRRWREDQESADWMADHPVAGDRTGRRGFADPAGHDPNSGRRSDGVGRRRVDSRPGSPEAVERGLAYHLACELTDLGALESREALAGQIAAMKGNGWITENQFHALDLDLLWAWWDSELGRRVRKAGDRVQREMPFTLRLEARDRVRLAGLAEGEGGAGLVAADEDRGGADFQVVQGVVDLAVIDPEAMWIVDYKTDQVEASEVEAKAEHYRFQLRLYAHALTEIHGRPVTEGWLYFMNAGRSVRVV
jgi:ATP-dependent helicase/nuclease subunit A